jgi:hypothetical protein
MMRRGTPSLVVALLLAGCLAPAQAAAAGSGERQTSAGADNTRAVTPESDATVAARTGAVPDSIAATPLADRVVVRYFHRTARCDNCLKFEAYADTALRRSFSDELAGGVLEWRVVNVDDTTNAHFLEDYGLSGISLIISIVRGGDESDWRSLDAIWDLVDDESAFAEYVAYEVGIELGRLRESQPPNEGSPPPTPGIPSRSEGAESGKTHDP